MGRRTWIFLFAATGASACFAQTQNTDSKTSLAGLAPPRAILERLMKKGIRIRQAWGMTETSPIATMSAEPANWDDMSFEQQLDMMEEGSLRGDELLHHHGLEAVGEDLAREGEPLGVDQLMARNAYEIDMAEESREGSELSGDEHSRGLQGGDSDLQSQPHLSSGLPGEQARHEQFFEQHSNELEFADLLPEDLEPPAWRARQHRSMSSTCRK